MMMMKTTSSTNQQTPLEENMSNLTSASGEASVSNDNNNQMNPGNIYPPTHHHSLPPPTNHQPTKKKRSQPGQPDPEAEVIALSPRTLMATNRFVCDVCNKGFQRDQNLQLHRRGHNLPWKLKQRMSKDVIRKKVYVCPETSCVHHDPSRALGDLTGIKKHFSRKHGEKKWKCDKCSKKYAVQSDWKAHSKICGTREYRCDCGTLFSRRDSFITHRAFCDALAEESNKATATISPSTTHHINLQQLQSSHDFNNQEQIAFQIKKEHHQQQQQNFPPWLTFPPPLTTATLGPPPPQHMDLTTASSSSSLMFLDFQQHNNASHHHLHHLQQHHRHQGSNPNPSNNTMGPTSLLPPFTSPAPTPHISATALLQKAAQLGSKSSVTTAAAKNQSLLPPSSQGGGGGGGLFITSGPHQNEVSATDASTTSAAGKFGLNLSSFDHLVNGLASYGNKAASSGAGNSNTTAACEASSNSLLHDMMMNNVGNDDYGTLSSTAFEDVAFGGGTILISNNSGSNNHQNHQQQQQFSGRAFNGDHNNKIVTDHGRDKSSADDGMMTRDFLGLRPLSESDMLSITGCWQGNN